MEGATEYRDTWRGLRMLVPQGWRVKRFGIGLALHDRLGQRLVLVQPRPGISAMDDLEHELRAWLVRVDPAASLNAEAAETDQTRVYNVSLRCAPDGEAIGVFAAQVRPAGGLISGFLGPAVTFDADSQIAAEAHATLEPAAAVCRYPWREPTENAATALVPRGWRTEGRIDRNNPGGVAAAGFQTWADDQTGVMASAAGRLYMEPGLLSGILTSMARGTINPGKFVHAATYAETHVIKVMREEAPNAEIEAIIPRPDLVPLAVAQEAAASGLAVKDILAGEPSAADVVMGFTSDGVRVRQISRVVTMRVPPAMARGLPLWTALIPHSYRAPADRFAEWEPVLEGISLSFRVDREWRSREQARIAKHLHRPLPADQPAAPAATLVTEAERLYCQQTGQQLGIHERPFLPLKGQPGEDEPTHPLLSLYEGCAWRGVGVTDQAPSPGGHTAR